MKQLLKYFIRLVLFAGIGCGISFVRAEEGPAAKGGATLYRHWRYVDGGDEEVIVIDPQVYMSRISGKGLPVAGLQMEKPIASIVPSPRAGHGQIILGPDETLSQPYQVVHWFDLTPNEVKLLQHSKVYPTVEAAKKDTQVDKEHAKLYRALRWGL